MAGVLAPDPSVEDEPKATILTGARCSSRAVKRLSGAPRRVALCAVMQSMEGAAGSPASSGVEKIPAASSTATAERIRKAATISVPRYGYRGVQQDFADQLADGGQCKFRLAAVLMQIKSRQDGS